LLLILFSCAETPVKEQDKITEEPSQDLKSLAKRHAEARLGISPTERYELKVYKKDMDGDALEDAIITVNRLEYAMNEASKSTNPAKQAEIGFMGNYNYIFYYDAVLDKISPEIVVPSSPNATLKVAFEHISSNRYYDPIVEYRILNAAYKDFYSIVDHTPQHVFQWKVYEGLNKEQKEAYTFKFDKGSISPRKDILVYKATLKDPGKVEDIYHFNPVIVPSDELLYRFFYYPAEGKYLTQK
jgi:hypothetical protein